VQLATEGMEDLLKHLWIDEKNKATTTEGDSEAPSAEIRADVSSSDSNETPPQSESPTKLMSPIYSGLTHPPIVGSASNDNDHRVWGSTAFHPGLPRSIFAAEDELRSTVLSPSRHSKLS
jgi:hypothetical protein